jgi:Dyp-type peroxidase family
MTTTYSVDLDQIQGNVAPGFRKDNQDYLFLRLPPETFAATPDLTRARAWIAAMRPSIATAREVATFNALYLNLKQRITDSGGQESAERFLRSTWVNVAFTYVGLKALLGAAIGTDAEQNPAFKAGMFKRASETRDYLVELGQSVVRDTVHGGLTDKGMTPQQEKPQVAHVLVIIAADSEAELNAELANQLGLAVTHGLSLVVRMRGESLGGGREHFGFRDGISQPEPEDLLNPAGWVTDATHEQIVAPGEFIRGATEEADHTARTPIGWETNGSYLVFRRLDQDVQRFRSEAAAAAVELDGDTAPGMTPALFEAKCLGRWPDGTPVDRAPLAVGVTETPAQKKARLTLDASSYTGDTEGFAIPRFAHIRKAHPREQTTANPRHHRLLRRGIPFGPMLQDVANGAQSDTNERGLLFVGYMASIEAQFEHLMRRWFNAPDFPATLPPSLTPHDAGLDPVLSGAMNNPTGPRRLEYATQPTPAVPQHQAVDIARFVTMKGGGYFFAPSINHIATLAGI